MQKINREYNTATIEKSTRLVSSPQLKNKLDWLSEQSNPKLKKEVEDRAQNLYELLQLQDQTEGNPWEKLTTQEQGYFVVYVLAIRYKIDLPEFAGNKH